MRILHIVPSYLPAYKYGGPVLSVSGLAEAQARTGATVTVYTTTANGDTELEVATGIPQEINGVTVCYFRRWTGDHGHFCPGLLLALWRNAGDFDHIHLHSWWNWVAFGSALICRNKRFILSPRGMLSPYTLQRVLRRRFQTFLGPFLLRNTLFHATSEQEACEIQGFHPKNQAFVLPNIVELPADQPEVRQNSENGIRLLFLSRIDHKKGLDLLLDALAEIPTPDWQLLIAGSGHSDYLHRLQQQAENLQLTNRINWLGWLHGHEKNEVLAGADLLVLPSRNDNFANVVLEALALGTPVVVSNLVGMSAYVKQHDLGWVVPGQTADLTQALKRAMSDIEKRNHIRRTAPERVQKDFSPLPLARRYLHAYQQT